MQATAAFPNRHWEELYLFNIIFWILKILYEDHDILVMGDDIAIILPDMTNIQKTKLNDQYRDFI